MSNHTTAVGACQPPVNGVIPQTSPAHADRRLVARYGAAALDAGYAAIPRVVIRHRRALTITAAEWDYICEVWSYWRSDVLPGPSVEDLARGLDVDQSTVRRHRASLERKGLLRVVPNGPYNRYDLRPLIDAAVGLECLQGDRHGLNDRTADTSPASGPRTSPPDYRAGLHATKEVEKKDDDSIPPYPPSHATAQSRNDPSCNQVPDDQTMVMAISALSDELGDDAPASSIVRAGNLSQETGMPRAKFLALIDEAAGRTRGRQDRIIARGRDGGPSGMRYFFAVLTDLLYPASPRQCRADVALGRRRANWPGRRRDALAEPGDHSARNVGMAGADEGDQVAPPSAEPNDIWRAVLVELHGELTRENYARWFAPTRVVDDTGVALRIAVSDMFHQQWLDRRLRGTIERTLARVAVGVQVEFVVDAAA